MKNLKFMAFAALAMFSLVFVSCSKDDDDNGIGSATDSGAPGEQSGTLVSDDATINAAVAGLRVTSVGPYRYTYDENGVLESISDPGEWTTTAKDGFRLDYEFEDRYGEYEKMSVSPVIKNNHIITISINDVFKEDRDEVQSTMTMNLTYNTKGQYVSAALSAKASGVLEGIRYSESGTGSIVNTYSADGRITQTVFSFSSNYGKTSYTTTYEYDSSSEQPNKFYQYTNHLCQEIFYGSDDLYDAFAYVGLLGKASSYIPTRAICKGYEEGEDYSYTKTFSCSFNVDGTISYADYYNYTYKNVGTRSFFESNEPVFGQDYMKRNDRKLYRGLMKMLRGHLRQQDTME